MNLLQNFDNAKIAEMHKDTMGMYRDRVTMLTDEFSRLIKDECEMLPSKDLNDIYIMAYEQGAIVAQYLMAYTDLKIGGQFLMKTNPVITNDILIKTDALKDLSSNIQKNNVQC